MSALIPLLRGAADTEVDAPSASFAEARLGRPRARLAAVAALTLALTFVLAALGLTSAQPANAATPAVGYNFGSTSGWVGAWDVGGGRYAYCLELDVPDPTGTTSDAGLQGWAGIDDDTAARINWAVADYGQTTNPYLAAAVQLFVWSLTSPAQYAAHGGDTGELSAAVGPDGQAAILSYLAGIRADAGGVLSSGVIPTATVTLTPDADQAATGSVVVGDVGPDGSHVRLVLTGAVFADTGLAERADVAPGVALAYIGTESSDPRTRHVTATATVERPWTYPAMLWVFATPGAQHLVAATPGARGTATGTAIAESTQSFEFRPIVSTRVPEPVVASGDVFQDTVFVDAQGTPWPRDVAGAALEVRVDCVVYGPFAQAPVRSPQAPVGAPVVGEFTIVATDSALTTAVVGATRETLTGPGFATAQCRIDAALQSDDVRRMMPDGYVAQDDFGIPEETVEVTAPPSPRTEVTPPPSETPALPTRLAETGTGEVLGPVVLVAAVLPLLAGLAALAIARRPSRRIDR